MIPFNKAPVLGTELKYISDVINSGHLCGDNKYSKKCEKWFEEKFNCPKTLLTPSCTASLEMAAILIDIRPGDEVIMPSYTFVSTANAFVLRGAKIVFVDIRPDTMNIDETKIEEAITNNTKAIVPVHYAGVACEMDIIMDLANQYELVVIEDAAQGVMSNYKGRPLGTIGHLAAYSFHETKNYTSGGEGGLLIINDPALIDRAEIIREKGTNRRRFLSGLVDKYTWVDIGSSYLPSELQSAYLYAQLESSEEINNHRVSLWNEYYSKLEPLLHQGKIELPVIPDYSQHNAHMFYVKMKNYSERTRFISYMNKCGIMTVFHYVPLSSSPAGSRFGEFSGVDEYTTVESEKLVRLPLYFNMCIDDVYEVVRAISDFFKV